MTLGEYKLFIFSQRLRFGYLVNNSVSYNFLRNVLTERNVAIA